MDFNNRRPTPNPLYPKEDPLHPSNHPSKPKLLVVEDDESIRTQMKWALAQDYEVFLAEDRPSAIEDRGKEGGGRSSDAR